MSRATKSPSQRDFNCLALWRSGLSLARSLVAGPYKKLIKYIVAGFSVMLFDMALMISLVELLAWSPRGAASLSFVFGSVGGFFLHKFWTYRDPHTSYWSQYSKFVVTALVGLLLNYLLMSYLLSQHLHYITARLVAIAVIFVWNFSINSCWTFRAVKTDLSTSSDQAI